MIKSCVREHHWSPQVIEDMFWDDLDYRGIEFWYNDLIEVQNQLKSKKDKGKK